ncbi:MAG: type II toxin-antitoxin system RelE/ParE family toxin [Desulfurivibrio sp.]|nr:type II toxin-antitoxin system RelE/ParE family toxin [Desulfurivibrio sp.]
MIWRVEFTPDAEKELARLDKEAVREIRRFLRERVEPDPRAFGKSLRGQLREFWRWRVGAYRILGRIEDDKLLVLVVKLGHRRHVYGNH